MVHLEEFMAVSLARTKIVSIRICAPVSFCIVAGGVDHRCSLECVGVVSTASKKVFLKTLSQLNVSKNCIELKNIFLRQRDSIQQPFREYILKKIKALA